MGKRETVYRGKGGGGEEPVKDVSRKKQGTTGKKK